MEILKGEEGVLSHCLSSKEKRHTSFKIWSWTGTDPLLSCDSPRDTDPSTSDDRLRGKESIY